MTTNCKEMTLDELATQLDQIILKAARERARVDKLRAEKRGAEYAYFGAADLVEMAANICRRINAEAPARAARDKAEREAERGRYEPGELLKNYRGAPLVRLRPGVFVYLGCGHGELYLDDGRMRQCSWSEAQESCREQGWQPVYVDRMDNRVTPPEARATGK